MSKLRSVVALALIALVAGCSFMESSPDTPNARTTLAVVGVTAAAGCELLAREQPKSVQDARDAIRLARGYLDDNLDYPTLVEKLTEAVNDARIAFYMTQAFQILDAYIRDETGFLDDQNTVAYAGVRKILEGCEAGLAVKTVGGNSTDLLESRFDWSSVESG